MDLVALGEINLLSPPLKVINKSIFRASDIRGVVGETLFPEDYYQMGLGIATALRQQNKRAIFVAQDARLTSPELTHSLISGLLAAGIDVFDLGIVPTPLMYFASYTHPKIDAGLMVTGSHNPPEYNGLKLVLERRTLNGRDLDSLYALMHKRSHLTEKGHVYPFDIQSSYQKTIQERLQCQRSLKVVVDAGNGVAGPIALKLMRALGCEVEPLYCEIDGQFPHHHPDPAVEKNLYDLRERVFETNADIGLAFDGDGDRLGVVTHQGDIIWPDRLLMFFASKILKSHPGATIVYDVKCSSTLPHFIETHEGCAKMCPTGHAVVKQTLITERALLAGEMSGHLFFSDHWFGFDDAVYSACRLLSLLSQSDDSVAQQLNLLPSLHATPEIRIAMGDYEKFLFMQKFSEGLVMPGAKIFTIDGIRAEYSDGFGLLRASQTTPALTARFEATTIARLNEIKALFRQRILALRPDLNVNF